MMMKTSTLCAALVLLGASTSALAASEAQAQSLGQARTDPYAADNVRCPS